MPGGRWRRGAKAMNNNAAVERKRNAALFYFDCITIVLIIAVFLKNIPLHSLWFDEATYFVNVRDIDWKNLASPLPFYDQVAPPGSTFILKTIYSIFGLNEYALRLPSLLAYLGMFFLARTFPRLNNMEQSAFALFLAISVPLFNYSFLAKHYLLEMFFILLMLFVNTSSTKNYSSFAKALTVNIVSIPFVTTYMIVIASTLAMALYRLVPCKSEISGIRSLPAYILKKGMTRQSFLTLMPILVGSILGFFWYLLILRPIAAPQITIERYAFLSGFPRNFDLMFPFKEFIGEFSAIYAPYKFDGLLEILFLPVFLLGMYAAAKRHRPLFVLLFTVMAVVFTLNIVRVFPMIPGRYSNILIPSIAFFVSIGIVELNALFPGVWWNAVAKLSIAIGVSIVVINAGIVFKNPQGQQAEKSIYKISRLFDRTKGFTRPVVITMGSQPLVDAYILPGRHADICGIAFKNLRGWTDRCTKERSSSVEQDGSDIPWYKMNYISDHVYFAGEIRDVSDKEIGLWNKNYVAYISRQLCASNGSYFLVSHLNDKFVSAISSNVWQCGVLSLDTSDRRQTWSFSGQEHFVGDARVFELRR